MIAELVRRARAGDEEAFTQLVRRFQDAVFATAYQRVLDVEAARDIAQEAFVRAYEALGELRKPDRFPAWLLRICRNLAADWLRRPERLWQPLDDDSPPPVNLASAAAGRDVVRRALSALPEHNRLAVSLFLVNGYTYQEIAEMTQVPATTVKGRIERGRRQLAQEVLSAMEDTLKRSAPDDEFSLQTVRESLERAWESVSADELHAARSLAEEANDRLAPMDDDEQEIAELRFEALKIISTAAVRGGADGWKRAWRDALRVCERMGDHARATEYLWMLAVRDRDLSETERDAICQRFGELARETGQHEYVMWALFLRCRIQMGWGEFERAFSLLDEARDALDGHDFGTWHPALEAADELRKLLDTGDGTEDVVCALAGGCSAKVDEQRLALGLCGNVGFWNVAAQERAKFSCPFTRAFMIRWFPHTGPGPGHEEKRSQTLYRDFAAYTHETRIRVESDEASVTTPAGEFDGCLLLRVTTTESPPPERPHRGLGERWWWFARGVGPVAYRAQRLDGIVEHALLSRFECPQQRDDWMPLVEGTRWEYVPAEPVEGFSASIVNWLCRVDQKGDSYLAELRLGRRQH